ncbi:MAG: HPr family phosphocarrier protein [Bacilli bacterium]|nr:HPr family phosphocarrier protein [Bacilli bacterium]MDD3422153.1 HPr family phosphocarrier protein [Bacilli bacterium]MDD4065459.1 HPr family phosphocarrier protein [Bacilli bacterium]
MVKESFVIVAPSGLSSRPSAALVFEANKFDCDLELHYANDIANMKSIMNIMALVIGKGEKFEIVAKGKDEVAALNHLKAYMKKTNLI